MVLISGVAAFGGTNAAGDRFAEKIPNWNENLTWIHHTHTFKMGWNASYQVDLQQDDSFNQYTFPSVAAYLAAKSGVNPLGYTTFSSRTDTTGLKYRSFFWGLYAQDSWQATPNLLVIYGLRYDRFQPPAANSTAPFVFSQKFSTPNGNVAPRLGLSYRLGEKTVVRASSGLFFEAPATNIWFNTLNQSGTNRTRNISFAPTDPGAPAFPSTTFTVTNPVQNIVTVAPDFKNAYAINASLQISRELSKNDVATIGYVFAGGRHFVFLRNINLINPTSTLLDGRPVFGGCGGTTSCSAVSF